MDCESEVETSANITILLPNWRCQGLSCNYTFIKFQNSLKPNNKPMLCFSGIVKEMVFQYPQQLESTSFPENFVKFCFSFNRNLEYIVLILKKL